MIGRIARDEPGGQRSVDIFLGIFPFAFVAMWLGITTVLSIIAGWFDLARQYPDRDEEALRIFRFQSGQMRGVSMSRLLRLEPCSSGLRIGIFRLFGPFDRDLFVPWSEISVERRSSLLFGELAKLRFGRRFGGLTLLGHVANKIARVVPAEWPEPGPFPKETVGQALIGVMRLWGIPAIFAASFFVLVPRLIASGGATPPVAVAILFPVIVMGVAAAFSVVSRLRD